MTQFSKQDLLSLFAPQVIPVSIEHDGKKTSFYVREFTARQIFGLQEQRAKALKEGKDAAMSNENFSAFLISEAMCDEKGQKVMSEQDAHELMDMKVQVFNKISDAIAEAVGLKPKEGSEPGKGS